MSYPTHRFRPIPGNSQFCLACPPGESYGIAHPWHVIPGRQWQVVVSGAPGVRRVLGPYPSWKAAEAVRVQVEISLAEGEWHNAVEILDPPEDPA